MREAAEADAALISQVVDDEWLEVVAVAGAGRWADELGRRRPRAEVVSWLEQAERRGRVRVTTRRALSYAELPGEVEPGAGATVLLAPLHAHGGALRGVLSIVGPMRIGEPATGAGDLLELYADQARLALDLMRERLLLEELRRLDEYRRDLVASVTHDLKTPLTAIALNAELLQTERRAAEAEAHRVTAIRRSAEQLSSLVDDLLALARAEERRGGEPGAVTDAVMLVRRACRDADVEAQQRGVRFVLDLPATLEVSVDGDALARVYANVIGNAVKFSLPDGEVRVSLRTADGAVEMVCADDGVGISAADEETVFDMFRRAGGPQARGVPGSGVGLAIAQRIMVRLGGTISLLSTPGQGSTFVVRCPHEAEPSTPGT